MTKRHANESLFQDSAIQRAVGSGSSRIVSLTGVNMIDAEHAGVAWAGKSLTYAFPDSPDDYSYGPEKDDDFAPATTAMQNAARYFLDTAYGSKANDGFSVEGFTRLTISKGTDADANLRYAQSSDADPSAYANFPGGDAAGDTWYGSATDFDTARQSDWKFIAFAHETGHALGLKHGQETDGIFPALDPKYNSQEYSIMTYSSYIGQDPEEAPALVEHGYPQTYMMADIAALQNLYGANFTVNKGNTVYSWKPTSGDTWVNGKVGVSNSENVILATIWDGGGNHDTYDLGAYSRGVSIDLRPGKYSVFGTSQLSDLDYYNAPGKHIARGSIFNALLYDGDKRSLIEDAIGGKGSDILTGNQAGNRLTGNGGSDTFYGLTGNDTYTGGGGKDAFHFAKGGDADKITDFHSLQDKIDLEGFGFSAFSEIKALADETKYGVRFDFGHGDSLSLKGLDMADLHGRDFIL